MLVTKEPIMPRDKIRLEQIEDGRILKQLITWFKISSVQEPFAKRFNRLRTRSRAGAKHAGIGPADVPRLIADVRSHRAKA
jgi:hypothetical protein